MSCSGKCFILVIFHLIRGLLRAVPERDSMRDGSWPPSPQTITASTTHVGPPQSKVRSAVDALLLSVAREAWQARCQTPARPDTRRSGAERRTVTPRPGLGCVRRVPKRGCRLIGRCRDVGVSAAEQGPIVSPGPAAWCVSGRVARRRRRSAETPPAPRVAPSGETCPRAHAQGLVDCPFLGTEPGDCGRWGGPSAKSRAKSQLIRLSF
jgi:hypothetical protein